MKIIVIGGAGFIGSNAAARYIRRGDEVIVLDDLSRQGTEINLRWLESVGNFEFIKGDIRDKDFLDNFFFKKKEINAVLHLAAQVAVTTSVTDPRNDFEVNALGTFNVLEAIKNSGQDPICIFSSTNKVYGNLDDIDLIEGEKAYSFRGDIDGVREDQLLDFHSPYGCSKGAADQYVRDYSRMYGLRTVVLRQSCIYGPRQFGIEDQGWVAWFIIAILLGKQLTIYGNGKQVRDILYIDDLLDSYDQAIENIDVARGRIYNIGGGPENQISLLKFLDFLSEITGKKISPATATTRPGDQPIYVSDITRAEKELGWKPQTNYKDGITKLYDWVLENKQTIETAITPVNRGNTDE
jgi:CDP-paratose 2-epimerase